MFRRDGVVSARFPEPRQRAVDVIEHPARIGMRLGDDHVHGLDIDRTARRVDTIAHAHRSRNGHPGKLGDDDPVDGSLVQQPEAILCPLRLHQSDFSVLHPIAPALVEVVGRPSLGAAERLAGDLLVPVEIEGTVIAHEQHGDAFV